MSDLYSIEGEIKNRQVEVDLNVEMSMPVNSRDL